MAWLQRAANAARMSSYAGVFVHTNGDRTSTVRIAHAVGRQAVADGVAPERSDEELAERIAKVRWNPEYPVSPE
jgi:malic enzyme